MLKAVPERRFSSTFAVYEPDGAEADAAEARALRARMVAQENGDLVVDAAPDEQPAGVRYVTRWNGGVVKPVYAVHGEGRELLRAKRASLLRDRFAFVWDGRCYEVRKAVGRKRCWLHVDGERVGVVRSPRLRRSASAQLPSQWPLPLQVFALWLSVLVLRSSIGATISDGRAAARAALQALVAYVIAVVLIVGAIVVNRGPAAGLDLVWSPWLLLILLGGWLGPVVVVEWKDRHGPGFGAPPGDLGNLLSGGPPGC